MDLVRLPSGRIINVGLVMEVTDDIDYEGRGMLLTLHFAQGHAAQLWGADSEALRRYLDETATRL